MVRVHTLYVFHSCKFIMMCVIVQYVVYLGGCSKIEMGLRRKYILLLLDGVFYKCQLDQLIVLSGWSVTLLIFYMLYLCTYWWKGIEALTLIADLSISPLSSISFCLMYFDSLLLDAYIFKTVCYVFKENWPFYH